MDTLGEQSEYVNSIKADGSYWTSNNFVLVLHVVWYIADVVLDRHHNIPVARILLACVVLKWQTHRQV
jgi:hypothetical protein